MVGDSDEVGFCDGMFVGFADTEIEGSIDKVFEGIDVGLVEG